MKAPHSLPVIVAAFFSAAVSFAQNPPAVPPAPTTVNYKVPAPGSIHPHYELASRAQLMITMDGRRGIVEWECFTEHDRKNDKPERRRTAWLVGTLRNPTGKEIKVSLHDIGAQHRLKDHILYVRLVPFDKNSDTDLLQTKKDGVSADPGLPVDLVKADVDNGQFTDFHVINPSLPDSLTAVLQNKYELTTTDTMLRLEVVYKGHLPGDTKAQLEDGGPPSIPPINEN